MTHSSANVPPTPLSEMLNSTVDLIALWASSSPSLLAFCFSHLIIAVLVVGSRGCALETDGRGECTPDAGEDEGTGSGGREDSAAAIDTGYRGCAPGVNGRAAAEVGDIGTGAIQLQASQTNGGREGASVNAADTLQERCSDEEEEEDELRMRADEFIQRMNRVWRTENVHC